MNAWRPYETVVRGELDNTAPGRVTGWISFVGLDRPVTFDLAGDFHRDVRGTKIRFSNPTPAEATEEAQKYMQGFSPHQTGTAGDITAGLPPHDYVNYGYVEWYSDQNGRVVLEFAPEEMEVIGTPLPWDKEKPVSREQQEGKMAKFLSEVASAFSEKTHSARSEPTEPSEAAAKQTNAARKEHAASRHETVMPIAEERRLNRVETAKQALSVYTDQDRRENLTDCLADAMHWSRKHGIDFDRCLERAKGHYQTEVHEMQEERSRKAEKHEERGIAR